MALSLCPLTIIRANHREMVAAAAAGGFDHVGLRLIAPRPGDPVHPLIGDAAAIRDLRSLMQDNGIALADIESLWLSPATDPAAIRPALETCAALGGRYVLVGGNDPDAARLTANFAAVAALAAEHGLRVGLEPHSYLAVRTLQDALALIARSGVNNAGILVDALHLHRAGNTPAELAAIDPARIAYVQICDAEATPPDTPEGLMAEARGGRLLPGEGGLPLAALMAALPRDRVIGVEAPTREFASLPLDECARRAGAAARAFLARRKGAS
ncbi:MAG: TIM barrel protein [Alphaproteobacteria bacterium]|nr:TIM barrel protein [Alphaproteobacteria bacterium]